MKSAGKGARIRLIKLIKIMRSIENPNLGNPNPEEERKKLLTAIEDLKIHLGIL